MPISLSELTSASSQELIKLTERRHPMYDELVEHWDFMEECYRGGRKWIDKNIFTYHKEGRKEYEKRKQRAYRFPHSREVISLMNKYVFKGEISRKEDDADEYIKEFWRASTLLKRPIEDAMQGYSTWSSTFGRIWIVVDNNYDDSIVSEADRKRSGGRIYSYHLKPSMVYDFAYDADGELEWILNGEMHRDDQNPLKSSGLVEERFRLWTKTFTVVISVSKSEGGTKVAKIVGEPREHNLGLVPVFPGDHIATDDLYAAPSLIEDVAYLDRAVANYLSNLDVIIQDQTFSQLAIPYQGLLPTTNTVDEFDDEEQDQLNQIQEMGHNRVFTYNGEGGVAPEFISPDVKQADIILRVVTKIVGEIYHSIGMAGERTKEDNAAGIDNSSGVAKAYDFERLNAALAAKARALEAIERNLIRMVHAWNGKKVEYQDVEKLVVYPTTFDVRNMVDEMDDAQRLSVMNAPVELRRYQMKRLAQKMFPHAPEEDLNKIMKDIEDEWLDDLGEPAMGALPTLTGGRVPGKRNSQGENNTGSRRVEDQE